MFLIVIPSPPQRARNLHFARTQENNRFPACPERSQNIGTKGRPDASGLLGMTRERVSQRPAKALTLSQRLVNCVVVASAWEILTTSHVGHGSLRHDRVAEED